MSRFELGLAIGWNKHIDFKQIINCLKSIVVLIYHWKQLSTCEFVGAGSATYFAESKL